ncbi:MAG: hypothetical protein KBC57_13395 [Neisseriaceae bacterium]|nr:hypothetical protein [Neisseriaceae bacterium]
MKYDPAPLFHSGAIHSADPTLASATQQAFSGWLAQAEPDAWALPCPRAFVSHTLSRTGGKAQPTHQL